MKVFIIKNSNSIVVCKETTLQSILSDIMSAFVVVLLIGLDIAFSLLVTHSFVIDIAVVLVMLLYFLTLLNRKKKEMTKEEIKDLIGKI